MINKIKDWLYWNAPIVTTRRKIFNEQQKRFEERRKVIRETNWSIIKQNISFLEVLRENTWDKDLVDNIIYFLKEEFEVTDD